jgi:uncharacterized cupin superfamily protein
LTVFIADILYNTPMGKYDEAKIPVRTAPPKSDPCIANVDEVVAEAYEKKDVAGTSWDVGAATGTQKLGVDVTEIPPGRQSSRFHCHSDKEEFFFVLSGRCRLRLGSAQHELRPGDAVSRPAGTGVAHQFSNPYEEPCRVLMIGVMTGEGVADRIGYPDTGARIIISPAGEARLEKAA